MLITIFVSSSGHAQAPLPGELERFRPGERRLAPQAIPPPPAAPGFELPEVPPPGPEAPLSEAPVVVLRGVAFEGNTAFTHEELAEAARPYLGRPVSTEDLQRLRRQITLHYVNRGYINSGAVLPDQRVEDGTVRIRIIEGHIGDIAVSGNEHLDRGYVRDRLALAAGPPLNVEELQERVQIVLLDPLIERIDVKLGPGTRLGEGELEVQIEESPRPSARATISNARPPSVGEIEGVAELGMRNLTGWGEGYRFTLAKTDGLREITGRFEIPVSARDTRVYIEIGDADSEVVETPFNDIDVESESRDYLIGVSHPVFRSATQTLSLAVEFERRRSETFLLGVPFSFSQGPRDGRSDVSVLRLVQNWLDRGQQQVLAAQSTFSKGFDQFGATTNDPGIPDGNFFSWLGQFQYVRRVLDDAQLLFRAEAQFTPDRLLPLEKYALGGANSVRGYRENQLVRDKGYAISLEGRIPVLSLPVPGVSTAPEEGTVEVAPFVDFGRSWDEEVRNAGEEKLLSAGAGLRWRVSRSVLATLYYARALRTLASPADEVIQDQGLHFRVSAGLP